MARLSNEEMRNMSPNQAELYVDLHPAEAWRFAKMFGREAVSLSRIAVKNGLKTEKLFADPESVLTNS